MALTEERRTTGEVPFAMTDPLHVPRERYYDREFFELEKERLWSKVWQMACRLEEMPRAGDFVEYEICDQSIILIRQPDMSVKGFHNACRHRATQLAKGSGHLGGGKLVCPFHGWRWNSDGTCAFVYGIEGFEPELVSDDALRLPECKVEVWGGCVWVNLDDDARPLAEHLAPIGELLETVGFPNMRVWWWQETVLRANWKMAQEAFFEGFHVMQTHPQLTQGLGENYPPGVTEHEAYPNGHSRFSGKPRDPNLPINKTKADDFIARTKLLWEGQDAMTLERDIRVFEGVRNKVGPDEDFGPAAIAALYEYAAGAGIPMPGPEAARYWGGELFVFPNFFVLPQFGNALCYRIRPHEDDPECCRFEVWSLTTYPEGQEPERARLRGRFDKEDDANWRQIPRQDFSNIERQQRGLHSKAFESLRLATEWEKAITNMHQELDRYLGD